MKFLQHLTEDWFRFLFQQWNVKRKVLNSMQTPLPMLIASHVRDCFAIKLITQTTEIRTATRRTYKKTTWYFPADSIPANYPRDAPVLTIIDDERNERRVVATGVVTYNNFFNKEELAFMEKSVDQADTESRAASGVFKDKPNTSLPTYKHSRLVRTKFFFNARYLFRAQDVKGKGHRAEGIRVDVAESPSWMHVLCI